MSEVSEQIDEFKGVRRMREFGKRMTGKDPGSIHGALATASDDKCFADAISHHLGSDELLAQFEAVGLDSKYIAEHMKTAMDNKKLSARDRRMMINSVLRVVEQSEGKKIKVEPGQQEQAVLQAELVAVTAEIERITGKKMGRLALVDGGDPAASGRESGGTEGSDRDAERGGVGDLSAATEG